MMTGFQEGGRLMDSPELAVAKLAGQALEDVAAELTAAFARSRANGTILHSDEYRSISDRLEVAEANWEAALARLQQQETL